jgi:hypothetical protein
MSGLYFSEREHGPKPRIEDSIEANVWGGLAVFVNGLADNGYFGNSFPKMCPDNDGVTGTDESAMSLAILAEFPDVRFPFDPSEIIPTLTILDLLEFCHEHIAKPIQVHYHSFWRLHHLDFAVEDGQSEFRARVNRIFARNGIAFELQGNGQIARMAPPVLDDLLQNVVFRTSDPLLDSMLETARSKYLDPSLKIRLEALEKLWDAWERIKTLEHPGNKKRSIGILLDKVSHEPNMRERLNREASELTDIGNAFMIRHTETVKIPITSSAHVDYLFHRMFALVYLLLGDRVGQKIDSASQDTHVEGN